jgi:hypothetical protein
VYEFRHLLSYSPRILCSKPPVSYDPPRALEDGSQVGPGHVRSHTKMGPVGTTLDETFVRNQQTIVYRGIEGGDRLWDSHVRSILTMGRRLVRAKHFQTHKAAESAILIVARCEVASKPDRGNASCPELVYYPISVAPDNMRGSDRMKSACLIPLYVFDPIQARLFIYRTASHAMRCEVFAQVSNTCATMRAKQSKGAMKIQVWRRVEGTGGKRWQAGQIMFALHISSRVPAYEIKVKMLYIASSSRPPVVHVTPGGARLCRTFT